MAAVNNSVADEKLLFSDPDTTWWVILNPDPTGQVISDPDSELFRAKLVTLSLHFSSKRPLILNAYFGSGSGSYCFLSDNF